MKITDVFIEDGMLGSVGSVAESLVPWFGIVVLALTAVFIIYSLYYFAYLKEECEMKYKYN
jgi:multisubunit Na+/H+ antiporter MnhB subunit